MKKLKEKEEICEKIEVKVVSPKKELYHVNSSLQSSQTLDFILNTQIPKHDKSRFGFIGKSSKSKENISAHHEVIPKIYADAIFNYPKV